MSRKEVVIPFVNFKKINEKYTKEFQNVLLELQNNAWYILGKNLENFENEYANFSNSKYCVGVANGLDALILSLKSLGISKGDEVIVPANTYIASWLAITHVGAKIIPVEPLYSTCNIDPDKIEEAITPRTKAVMAVNLYGQAAELDRINYICNKYNLFLVEDNAQSQGAKCDDKMTGTYGIVNATSFYPGKNLGALGDAGAVTTNDIQISMIIKTLRNYGSNLKYYNEYIGFNSRLDELQAGFLSLKLKDLEEMNKKRQIAASDYTEQLSNIEQIQLPEVAKNCTSVFHIYQIRIQNRDKLQKFLFDNGISTMVHYPVPPHLQKAYKSLGFKKGDFPISEKNSDTTLSLPMDPFIEKGQVDYICDTIKNFLNINK